MNLCKRNQTQMDFYVDFIDFTSVFLKFKKKDLL